MKLLTRIYAIALLGLLALLAALLLLAQQAQQTRQAELQALRDGHLLRNLRTAAENYLATGLQLEQLEILQQVIAREQAAFAGVVAIDVFAAGGTVLYSTDVGNRGTQVPEGWRTWLARDLPWDSAAPGQRQIGTRFENDLGQAAGGIVVTFSTVPVPLTLAQWYERGQQAVLQPLPVGGGEGGGADPLEAQFPGDGVQGSGIEVTVEGVGVEVDAARLLAGRQLQGAGRVVIGQRGKHGQTFRAALLARRREDVEDAAAADGVAGRGIAQDETVAGQCPDVALQRDLRPVFATRRNFVGAEQGNAGRNVFGTQVEMDLRPVLERRLAGQDAERGIETVGRRVQGGGQQPHAAVDFGLLDTSQGQGDALPGMARFGCCVLHTQAAHAHGLSRRRQQ